ncbi:MAG: oxidoreductase [Blastopirellula sp.]|nr:MAG: oxidoreductase [Blastopirellula sp.]
MSYWNDKIAIVTGASSGFGLVLATQLVRQGATVVLVARDEDKLEAVCDSLNSDSDSSNKGTADYFAADVTSTEDVTKLFAFVSEKHGRLDLLVNNAGLSARGRIEETSLDDFAKMIELNVMAVVRCSQAAIPLLRKSKGHLVNIGSLASKSASKFIGPYATTKFAVAGLTHQLRLELAEDGIHVMLVCPGPITRSDSGSRYNDQAAELPAEIRKPGAGVKIKTLCPEKLAADILTACEKRKSELVRPSKAKILFAIAQLSPAWGDWVLKKFSSSKNCQSSGH